MSDRTLPMSKPQSLLGMGLPQAYDWYPPLLANALLTARPPGVVHKPWVPYSGAVDANGWPTGDFGLICNADVPVEPGAYRLVGIGNLRKGYANGVFDDNGTVDESRSVKFSRTVQGDGFFTADFTLPAKTTSLTIHLYGSGVQPMLLQRPDTIAGQIWHAGFVEATEEMGLLRAMDATTTNNSKLSKWADRPAPSNRTWTGGIPLEALCALCEATGADLWYNVPHLADDDFIKRAAELFRDGLTKGQRVYFEWSNEVWNLGDFEQARHNWQAAKSVAAYAVPWSDEWTRSTNRIADQSLRMAKIVKPILGERARCILPIQVVRSKETLSIVWPAYFKSIGVKPADWFYAVAGAPYADLAESARNDPNITIDGILAGLDATRTKHQDVLDMIAGAKAMGLEATCYEGGPNISPSKRDGSGQRIKAPAKIAIQSDPRYAAWHKEYYRNWFEAGGKQFCHYMSLSPWRDDDASFGIIGDATDLTGPKFKAHVEIADKYRETASRPEPLPPVIVPPKPVDPVKPATGFKSWLEANGDDLYVEATRADGKVAKGNLKFQ